MTIEDKHNRRVGHVTLFSDAPDEVEEFGKGIVWKMKRVSRYLIISQENKLKKNLDFNIKQF